MKKFLIFLILTTIALTNSSCGILWDIFEWKLNYLTPQHTLEENNEYEVVWNRSDINALTIINSPGKIIVEGFGNGNVLQTTIFGIDSTTGNILWEIGPSPSAGAIIVHNNILYLGTTGTAVVYSHDIENGELLWSTLLLGAHGASDFYFANNKLYVLSGNDMVFVLNEKGKIVDSFWDTSTTFLESDGILYMPGNYSIKAIDSSSREELWQLDIGQRYTNPVFDGGEIFLRTGNHSTDIYSIDQYKGRINWVTSQNVRSNLCLIGDKIYFTNSDGDLVAINRYSGNEISRVKFSPQFDLEKQIGGYYIACETTNNVLTISFGDNTQIIGLKIMNP